MLLQEAPRLRKATLAIETEYELEGLRREDAYSLNDFAVPEVEQEIWLIWFFCIREQPY